MLELGKEERSKLEKRGLLVVWLLGGTCIGLMAVCIPFTLPALRRHCLPYVPATAIQIEKVMLHVKGRRGKVVDLGSGDGRVVIAAAKAGHHCVGYELNTWLVLFSKFRALLNGVSSNTEFYKKDLWKMEPLGKKLSQDLSAASVSVEGVQKNDYRIIACRFQFPQQTPSISHRLGHNSVWVYDDFNPSVASLIDYNVALYVLVGISVFHSVLALLFGALGMYLCIRTRCKMRNQYERQHDDMFLQMTEKQDQPDPGERTDILDTSFVVTNMPAVAMYSEKDSTAKPPDGNLEKLLERNNVFLKPFSYVLPIGKINRVKSNDVSPESSDFALYTPRSTLRVQVPYSEPQWTGPEGTNFDVTSSKVLSPHDSTAPGFAYHSPFKSRKKLRKEIPSFREERQWEEVTGTPNEMRTFQPDVADSPSTSATQMINTCENMSTEFTVKYRPKRKEVDTNSLMTRTSHFVKGRVAGKTSSHIPQDKVSNLSPVAIGTSSISTSDKDASVVNGKVLLEKLKVVQHKWYAIGLELEYSETELSAIMKEYPSMTQRLSELCRRWSSQENASWLHVVKMLRSLGEEELANSLNHEHCLESISITWIN